MGQTCSRRSRVPWVHGETWSTASAARVQVVLTEEQSLRAQQNWICLVKSLFSVRKLQRYYAYIGHRLQQLGKSLRKQLVLCYPKVK